MEFCNQKKNYFLIKISTSDPGIYNQASKLKSFLRKDYNPGASLLVLVFLPENVDEILERFVKLFPGADIVETGLSPVPGTPGYEGLISEKISIISGLGGMMPKERQVLVKSFLSFGSGFHPTTRLCARLMERMFSGRMKDILDVGTGSGILALCAWRLGARRVLAVDTSFGAIKEAGSNIKANGASGSILVVHGSADCARPKGFDLVVANLTIGVMKGLAPSFPLLLRKGGHMILSGFVEKHKQLVLEKLESSEIIEEDELDGWKGVVLSEG